MSSRAEVKGVWKPHYAIWIALQEDGEKQKEFAERIGMDPSKLSRIISGKLKRVDLSDWQRIAAGQNRPLSWYMEPPAVASLSRVNPRYRDWPHRVGDNHSPLGLATHPTPLAATLS
jgi:transcriptional regulator with XRE-family HTH domain